MKSGIFFIILMAALSLGPVLSAGEASAMGPDINTVQPEDKKLNGKHDGKNRGSEITEEGSSEGKDADNREEPSSREKPRIKYRDMFECSC
jgi:hypothetical protein